MGDDRKDVPEPTDIGLDVPTRDEWEDALSTFFSHMDSSQDEAERRRVRKRAGDEAQPASGRFMVVKCEQCKADVRVPDSRQPITHMMRPADVFGPRTYFIMAAGWHLHRCVVADVDV